MMALVCLVGRVQVQRWYGFRAPVVVWELGEVGWEMREERGEAVVAVAETWVEADEVAIWVEGTIAEDWF